MTHDTYHTLLLFEVSDMRRTKQNKKNYMSIHEDAQYLSQN